MIRKRMFIHLTVAAAVVFLLAATVFIAAIGTGVHRTAAYAQHAYGGSTLEALTSLVYSKSETLKIRNRAVWALGQLGDPRSLAVLEPLYTGAPCDHERFLCQRELKKAIAACRGGANVTRIFWRPFMGEIGSSGRADAGTGK